MAYKATFKKIDLILYLPNEECRVNEFIFYYEKLDKPDGFRV